MLMLPPVMLNWRHKPKTSFERRAPRLPHLNVRPSLAPKREVVESPLEIHPNVKVSVNNRFI